MVLLGVHHPIVVILTSPTPAVEWFLVRPVQRNESLPARVDRPRSCRDPKVSAPHPVAVLVQGRDRSLRTRQEGERQLEHRAPSLSSWPADRRKDYCRVNEAVPCSPAHGPPASTA